MVWGGRYKLSSNCVIHAYKILLFSPMFVCYLSMFYSYVVSFVLSFYMSRLNFLFLFVLLSSFLFLRFPHLYGILGFFEVVFFLIFPLFLSLFFSRLFFFKDFSASFVPEGSPQIMAFFVSFAELVSYFIRPFVLMLRPYLNLSLGCLVSHYL